MHILENMAPGGLLRCFLLLALLSLSNAGLVKKILRHRRQTPPAPEEYNATVPGSGHPVVFNHVYNINVPASSLCAVSLDSPDGALLEDQDGTLSSGHQTTEHTVDGENQIVFTHRINIPRQACGCSEDVPGLRDLMNRLEMLEGEVSVLKDQCSSERMCCSSQVTGEVAIQPYCNGHGNYSSETCGCTCEPGWGGTNCTEPDCPGNCQDRGRCVDGKCECFEGFGGENCTAEACAVDCGANGRCVGGACVCTDGFSGAGCTETECPNNCRGRGRCEGGACACEEPWTAADCSELLCPKGCSSRGRCANGTCSCDEGYAGDNCGERACPGNCHGNGFCAEGRCTCIAGFSGEDCSQLNCLNDCSGRGTCYNGLCICDTGYQGEDCSQLTCLNSCNGRGQCINGRCSCDAGFHGEDCGELSCPNSCLDRGRCVNGQCVCEEGYGGEDCRVVTCPSNCYGRGMCAEGRCACHAGFTGHDCGKLSCPNSCRERGRCVDGQCVCDEGFAGEDCGRKACPNDCLSRGYCDDGECVCREGYAGDDCSVLACPADCNGRGRCVGGRCACEGGYEGESCAERSCLNGCRGNGRCLSGQCLCDEGYMGEDCSEVSPPTDLVVSEVTSDTVDLSWRNQMLVTEYLVTYAPTRPGGLLQEFSVPGDKTAATVAALEPGLEYIINVYAVLSDKRSVPVSARVATDFPRPEGVIFKSVSETSVEVMWDQLDIPFDGWEIYFRNTKEENGQVKTTVPSSQSQLVQSGLGPGQEYEIAINMVRNNTRGPQTTKKITTKIDAPQQVEVKDVTDTSALVGWSQPVATVDRITMFYGLTSDPSDTNSVEIFPPNKQYSVDGLRPDTEYKVTLISRRGDSTSDPVSASFSTALDAPKNLQIVSQTDQSITVQWTNSKANVSSYLVKYSPISGESHGEELFPRLPGATTKATLIGLRPGTEYGIGVTAVKNETESLPATTNVETEIDPPRNVEHVESSETSLTLKWEKPEAKISTYRLVYVSRDGQVEEEVIPASATSYIMSNLTPGMSYSVTLTAERGLKRSRPVSHSASTVSFTFYLANPDDHELTPPAGSEDNPVNSVYLDPSETQFSGMEPEDEPGMLTVSAVAPEGFDLSWNLTAHGVYDSFTVQYADTRQLWDMREVPLPADVTGTSIRGLKALTEYQIKLYGVIHNQRSALLEAVAVTAPKSTSPDTPQLSTEDAATPPKSPVDEVKVQTPPPLAAEAPFMPGPGVTDAELTLGNLTFTSSKISLTWSAPDLEFESFLMEVSVPSGVTHSHVTLPGNARKAEIEGLSPSTQYNITIQGLVEGKRSLPLSIFATTAEELEPVVTNLTVSDITWDRFTVSWTPSGGEFDSFVIEITNLENLEESRNLTLSGGAFNLDMSGLNPNTNYMVGLFGVYQDSVLAPVYTEATTVEMPEVGNLYITNLTSDSFSILWNGTNGAFDGFVLEIIDSNWLMEPKEYNLSHLVRSLDITGLRPSTDYVAYLYGTSKSSRSNTVSIVASTAEAPDLSRLVVSNVTSDRFSLSWQTGEKPFDNFVVELRESALPSQAMGRVVPGEARSTVMAGLKASTSYDIKLYGSAGGRNTQALFDVATTEDVPQLGLLTASSVSPHDISASWSTLSGHFDGFVMRVSDPEQQFDTQEFRLPRGARNFTVSNLVDATAYDVELYGISHDRHTPSVFAHAVTAPLPKVENMSVSHVTPYGFRVSWEVKQQAQQEDLAPPSGHFRYFHIVVTDSGWLLEPQEFSVPGNQTHLDVTGLITGIGYEVRLTGVSESGLLSRPLTTVAVTEAEPEVEHLFVSDIADGGFRLSWTSDEDTFDRFVVKIRDAKRLAHPQEYAVRGDERTMLVTGLMSGTEYEIELYGVALDKRSQPVTGVAHTGLSTPKGLHFSDVTDSSAVVHWSTPRSLVDSYRVTYVPFEGGSPMTVTVGGGVFEALLANMIPGKTYQVTVSSVKGLEESDPSMDTVTTALDRPQSLTALNVTDASALLLWQPCAAAVDSYVISYSAESVPPIVEHVSGNTAEFQMRSLVPGTRYQVGVHAVKEALKSNPAFTEFTTDVDPPRDLKATNIQTDSATLTWKPPQAAVTGYTLTFSSADGVIREVVLSPTASSYSMAQLSGSTDYSVRLQAIAGAQRSRHVDAAFTTIGQMFTRPRDCAHIWLNGDTTSGLYSIYVGGEESQPLQVYCDMTTDGGGWTVFLRRQNGKLEFFRNWKNYTAGFGNLNDEFWLGLTNLHKITSSGHYELRVDLRDSGESAFAQYDKFVVAEPRTRYKLHIGAYSGTAGDSMTYHQGRPFSTYDNDNDIAVTNCALSYKGAFWYKNCHRVNLMGKYGDKSHSKGINWFHWRGHEHSIEFAEMKLRPANFKNPENRRKRS